MSQSSNEVQDLDTAFAMLGKRQRRRLLLALLSTDSLSETDVIGQFDGDQERLRIEIRHTDLPKLSRAGYISWEQDESLIRRGPAFDEIRPLLEWCAANVETLSDDSPN